jgi:hypothetical protein
MPQRHIEKWRYHFTILNLCTRHSGAVSFMPWLLYPKETTPHTHCVEGWMDPRAGLDAVPKRAISCPHRESDLDSLSVIQPITWSLHWLRYPTYSYWLLYSMGVNREQKRSALNNLMIQTCEHKLCPSKMLKPAVPGL